MKKSCLFLTFVVLLTGGVLGAIWYFGPDRVTELAQSAKEYLKKAVTKEEDSESGDVMGEQVPLEFSEYLALGYPAAGPAAEWTGDELSRYLVALKGVKDRQKLCTLPGADSEYGRAAFSNIQAMVVRGKRLRLEEHGSQIELLADVAKVYEGAAKYGFARYDREISLLRGLLVETTGDLFLRAEREDEDEKIVQMRKNWALSKRNVEKFLDACQKTDLMRPQARIRFLEFLDRNIDKFPSSISDSFKRDLERNLAEEDDSTAHGLYRNILVKLE